MKILLIEDDTRIAGNVVRGLSEEGFDVTHVDNGEDGLWHAVENSWDLFVLDIMLPGVNGFMLCAEVRKADIWTPIPHVDRKGRRPSTRQKRSTQVQTTT